MNKTDRTKEIAQILAAAFLRSWEDPEFRKRVKEQTNERRTRNEKERD